MITIKKYVLVGTGSRGYSTYAKAIYMHFSDIAQLVGLFDPNNKRCEYVQSQLSPDIPAYSDFDRMMTEQQPDVAIITTVDRYHMEYILHALEHKCAVICEKPMAIDDEMCNKIIEAEKLHGIKIAVTFNCRFIPIFIKLKELMSHNTVGEVLNIDFEWFLDTSHGADYFRRWHRKLENSGGLLVHKATHHFDVINWLIEQDPKEVYANGKLVFYGSNLSDSNGTQKGERCLTCGIKKSCKFAYKNAEVPLIKGLYFEAEPIDGYYRDRCVFSDEIDIYDNMSLTVKYNKDALLTYSLIAHSPYEGWRLTISGTNGRIEAEEYLSGSQSSSQYNQIKLYNRLGDRITIDVEKQQGDHGGGDTRMLDMLLRGYDEDKLNQCAGSREGAMSAIIGIAANKSILEKKVIFIDDLLHL